MRTPARAHPRLMWLARWLNRRRWLRNVARIAKLRETLSPEHRQAFDMALCPIDPTAGVLSYPEAFYRFDIDDVLRAFWTSRILANMEKSKA